MDKKIKLFPFVAVVGQEGVKNALIWNLVNPDIGGLLISGEKGTAKSSLARGVCELSEEVNLVNLPLNVTEDRLCGNIDLEYAIQYGKKKLEPGILKKAHGNMLYVDEVNLLSDHIVKSLLEAASSGVNIIEREGLSEKHDARFILVGSMNPEEGGLRPQFLDRFGLFAEVEGEKDLRMRAEIMRRRIEFEQNPTAFFKKWEEKHLQLKQKIEVAKEDLKKVKVTQNAMQLAATMAKEANCEGHRCELVIIETAKAIAALDGRKVLNISDIKEAAKFAIPHRVRDAQPPLEPPMEPPQEEEPEESEESSDQENEDTGDDDNAQSDEEQTDEEPDGKQEQQDQQPPDDGSNQQEQETEPPPEMDSDIPDDFDSSDFEAMLNEMLKNIEAPDQVFRVSNWLDDHDKNVIKKGSGKRSLMITASNQGRYVRNRIPTDGNLSDLALDATLRMAAPYQKDRNKNQVALAIEKSDIRVKVREKRTGNTIIFVVDASGSMGANRRMRAVKGAILSLLNDAYQKRDKVGLIAFREQSAEMLLGITRSVDLAQKKLTDLPTQGQTPLAAGLDMAYEVIKAAKIKDKDVLPVIVLVSDGRATYAKNGVKATEAAMASARRIGAEKIKTVVVDTEEGFVRLKLAHKLAEAMNAECFELEELRASSLLAAVTAAL